jgi:hypothetical protein
VRQLASLEKAIGTRLPESIREWYSLKDAEANLCLQDILLHFEPFGIDQNAKTLKQTTRSHYRWIVGAYSSGVYFAVDIPGEPDAIVRMIETDGSYVDDADEWSNRPFSAFVFACCWHKLQQSRKSIAGVVPSFFPGMIDMLIDLFDEGPRVMRGDAAHEHRNPFTGEQMLITRFRFFFFGPSGMLHLRSQNDPTTSETEVKWQLSSPDEPTLKALASQLRNRGILPQ